MASTTLTIRVDRASAGAITALFEEISAAAEALETLAEPIQEAIRSLLDAARAAPEALLTLQPERGSAVSAGEMILRFEPSDRLRRVAAAVRTGNADCLAVEAEAGHGPISGGEEPKPASLGDSSDAVTGFGECEEPA